MTRIYHITGHYESEQSYDTYVVVSNDTAKAHNEYMAKLGYYDDDIIFYADEPFKIGDNLFDDFYVDNIIDIM